MNKVIQEFHYAPKTVDDSLSNYVFVSYLHKLDEDDLILTKPDLDSLQKHRYQLDDYLTNQDCSFFEEFYSVYKKRLNDTKNILSEINVTQLDYSGKDSLHYYQIGEKRKEFSYADDTKELKRFWSKKIRKETIDRYLDIADSTSIFSKEAPNYAQQIISNELCTIADKLNDDVSLRKKMQDWFLNTFCSYFDPHTNYFNNSEKSFFDESIHDDFKSIGVFFSKNDEGIVSISEVQPGSSAWKHDMVSEGDEVLEINSNKKKLDMNCIGVETLYSFIYDPENTAIQFKIRKKETKEITDVTLKKENIHVSENTVDSYILDGSQKIGYIRLPSFYTSEDFGMGCANDIAKEVLRLNKEGISALVLDLRDNGGGSLQEATDLVGLFIDRGPVAIINNFQDQSDIYKDYNRGTIFSKPMVVMVNGHSASASEYVSAALQDHQRAFIVGSPTFGKGSGQIIRPVNPEDPKAGFVKVTIEKLYRITGKSWQKSGVIPDFELPSALSGYGKRESDYKNVLAKDTIVKKVYFKFPSAKNISSFQVKSSERLAALPETATINHIKDELKRYADDRNPIPLTLKAIESREQIFKEIIDQLNGLHAKNTFFTIENTEAAKEILSKNSDATTIDDSKKKSLSEDFELIETYHILNDIIKH
ncbi:carboxy terminal-processing peptidase [Pustulibacterium marinum]|uniref:carboxy terminal-processing peptidase n=1 Tax=Pustulibacterium marinum TaxID=1224947 RepID=UPI0015A68D38|nr:carboxy terminal-processing peptidase [Pustulibacterium marinum]